MNNNDSLSSAYNTKRKWTSIAITLAICGTLTLWAIYGLEEYGIILFILIPLILGIVPATISGRKTKITRGASFRLGLLALGLYSLCLFLFAMEGIICIAMAFPIALLLTWIGTLIGYAIVKRRPDKALASIAILLFTTITTGFIENNTKVKLQHVTTAIEIDAPPEKVWENVIAFSELDAPDELMFKAGIAYPINAEIEGEGVGAVRHCNFNTGSFVEPITVWNEPELLAFDVEEQPASMKELSFWDIDAPHLHDYFVSKKGQFKLIALPDGTTRLEGTTWYYNRIRPNFYWNIWSDYIVHKIHHRVLKHIKEDTEQ